MGSREKEEEEERNREEILHAGRDTCNALALPTEPTF